MNSAVCDISIVSEVSADDFRNAMRRLTGGVSVITAGRGRDISGMTVTSVTSLSVDPPTLIVSVNRGASSWPLIRRYGFFGVNILNADQLDIAERFTGKDGLKGAARFAGADWFTRASGAPLLSGARLQCIFRRGPEPRTALGFAPAQFSLPSRVADSNIAFFCKGLPGEPAATKIRKTTTSGRWPWACKNKKSSRFPSLPLS